MSGGSCGTKPTFEIMSTLFLKWIISATSIVPLLWEYIDLNTSY